MAAQRSRSGRFERFTAKAPGFAGGYHYSRIPRLLVARTGHVAAEAEQAIEASISLERDIEDQLVHQLDALEEGLTFVGRQVTCDVGRVDIAGRGADGVTVVVELKVGEAKDSAIGQIARYMGWHQQHQGAGTVRGILVASDFPEGVQYAARAMPNLALRRYHIQLAFEDASLGE